MYLHLGQMTLVKKQDVVAILDLDTCSISKKTRLFLASAEKKGWVINTSTELPKSFIITCDKNKKHHVFISQIATKTLKKRLNWLNAYKVYPPLLETENS